MIHLMLSAVNATLHRIKKEALVNELLEKKQFVWIETEITQVTFLYIKLIA